MEVPEPRTVTFSGACGMVKASKAIFAAPGETAGRWLRTAFGLGFGSLGGERLIDFEIGHLQFAQQVQ